jgi:hypothetical protein
VIPTRSWKPRQVLAALGILAALTGCQTTGNHPVPSVTQLGSDLSCTGGDHAFEDALAGWGFCYPGTWRFTERSQASVSPPGGDVTFDVTDVPCSTSGASAQPVCSPGAGLFAFMIISTYQRGDAVNLAGWDQTNLGSLPPAETITWGNAVEALKLADGRRIALTPHQVVILSLHAGAANLDLEAAMSTRLATWKFTF